MTVAVIIPTLDPKSPMLAGSFDTVAAESLGNDGLMPYVQHDEHRDGFAHTCNLGAKRATDADLLIFLNDDTIPQPGWLDALVSASESHAIVGGHLTYPDGATQHSGVFLRRHGQTLEAYNRKRPAPSGEVPAVTGACLAIRREVWDELGGFDEAFVNGYEDVDLCLRARQAGHEVSYVAESTVVHLESQSEGRWDHTAENVALLQQRWGHLPI